VFDADCCNGIVTVAIVGAPFCCDTTGDCDGGGREDADGREATIDAGASDTSTCIVCAANSGGGTWIKDGA